MPVLYYLNESGPQLNMGPETETTRNPLGLGICRNLVSGSVLISRNPTLETNPETQNCFGYPETHVMIMMTIIEIIKKI
jgi:hypothetical protein